MNRTAGGRQAEHWREQAVEARARADKIRDFAAKSTMLEIAQKYDAMAELAARRETSSP
jgi:hypothetical protein